MVKDNVFPLESRIRQGSLLFHSYSHNTGSSSHGNNRQEEEIENILIRKE